MFLNWLLVYLILFWQLDWICFAIWETETINNKAQSAVTVQA